ncbi:Radical SAM protein [Azospirillaceae bacterium]
MTSSSVSSPPRLYHKADSFVAWSGGCDDHAAFSARIFALQKRLVDDVNAQDAHRRAILEQACADLLNPERASSFRLRPHIIEELRRVSDEDLSRYLFYRYRYDVFPIEKRLDAFPPCLQIEPTSICNYRCVFCFQTDVAFTRKANGHMGQMSFDLFKQVIDQIVGQVEAVTLASRGEPLLCRDIDKMIAYAAGKFLGFKINTNAWFLDEAKSHALLAAEPNTLVFSADAADPALYRTLRVNGDLDRVLSNIRRFQEIRARHYSSNRTIVRVSGVRYSNDQNFEEIEAFWRALADQVAFVDYNPWENAYEAPENGVETPCSDLWRRCFVWWDGRVNPCDVDYRSTLAIGSIVEKTLSELWRGENYEQLRKKHLTQHRQKITPCRGCAVV